MEIKVGMYARLDDNVITKYTGEEKTMYWIEAIVKIANTPQELIEVRDLLFLNRNEPYIVEKDSYGTYIIMNNKLQYIETLLLDITKILTPNSNGSVYTQQWSILDDKQR